MNAGRTSTMYLILTIISGCIVIPMIGAMGVAGLPLIGVVVLCFNKHRYYSEYNRMTNTHRKDEHYWDELNKRK